MSNSKGWGQRLGPDQNGWPVKKQLATHWHIIHKEILPEEVSCSGGKLNNSCLIWLWYCSCQWRRAQWTHCSKFIGRSSTKPRWTASRTSSGWDPVNFSVLSMNLESTKYWAALSADCRNNPSNISLAHCSVCSIALGKFFSVQKGIDFSGGSFRFKKRYTEKIILNNKTENVHALFEQKNLSIN